MRTAASGGRTRLGDLHVSIAPCLTAHALNIGYGPIVKKGVEALERDRISHVNQSYLGAETYSPANRWLIEAQAGIAFAGALGGGLVAAVDGMRFVVPVPSIYALPTASTSARNGASPGSTCSTTRDRGWEPKWCRGRKATRST